MNSPASIALFTAILLTPLAGRAADWPQWGARHSRNMVSAETGLPSDFDPTTGRNVKWTAALGTRCFSSPVVAQGRVLIGTNNGQPRDPRHQGDRGVLMCFDAADGSFRWQLVVPKLDSDPYLDWPRAGICSPPTVEGDRVYTVTNRDEVVCLDLNGLADGNDGPFQDEGRHMTPAGDAALAPGPRDADIIWLLDLRTAAGVRPHDSAHASILIDGPNLYVNTSNGLNSRHEGIERPEAPSLVVLDKRTGRLIAREDEGISPRIFHAAWSSPSLGEVDRRRLIFHGGGDGVCYAFEALPTDRLALPDRPTKLTCVWRFDCDPTAPKQDVHQYIRNRRESPSVIMGMPVFHDGRVYLTVGGDLWWGKRQCWAQCIDPRGEGDITDAGLVWASELNRHCCVTPAVHDGLVFVADCKGIVHCLDANAGTPYWTHETRGEIWASPLVADGKVYVGNRRGEFCILAASKEKELLSSTRLGGAIHGTVAAADGTVFIATDEKLLALEERPVEKRGQH